MNTKIKGYLTIASLVIIPTVLLTTLGVMTQFRDAVAQNATAATNQTGAQNATAATPFGNLTSSWFDSVRENLAAAREALFQNDTVGTYSTLGYADIQLFAIANDPNAGSPAATLMQELKPVADRIAAAQDELQNNDANKANEELNIADLEMFKLNQQLPPEPSEVAGEEED
jgi:hypothetical protein